MRSRYAAYALGLIDYIVRTTHPEAARSEGSLPEWERELKAFCAATRFRSLEVLRARENGDKGQVCFRAFLFQGERDVSFQEVSEFSRWDGRWFYRSGTTEEIEGSAS